MSSATEERSWVPLSAPERRVVGVLVEKQKTTPEYYPMSVNALVSGCNQKSNRDPVTNYDADQVEEILEDLRRKGAVARVEGSGRVIRWKHLLYDWLKLRDRPVAMAVLAELLLRGPQTEGDLRARASRMDPILDLDALQKVLAFLVERGLVVYLTPPGQRRGVIVTHALYPPRELEQVRAASAGMAAAMEAPRAAATSVSPSRSEELDALKKEVEALRDMVRTLQDELQGVKSALGI